MNGKQSLYTKYRPQTFEQVVGQNIAKNILVNSINENKINHAYLFYGIRGTGKTTLARIFAKAVNCENKVNSNPCDECESCVSIKNGSSYDVIEIDAASNNGVDEIRSIKENTNYLTTSANYKVYIIDEVHMLTKQAFNALLKTLEEPPRNTIFLLATTELQKIPQTVLSRTIIVNLEVMSNDDIKQGLENVLKGESINYDVEALDYITMIAGGSLRDAISFLETSLLYNSELNVSSVVSSLGLIKKEDIERMFNESNINELITLIDESNKDSQKIILLIADILSDMIKSGKYAYVDLLTELVELAFKIKDPLLLKVSIKSVLLKYSVSRETISKSNVVENSISVEEQPKIEVALEEENISPEIEKEPISLRNEEIIEENEVEIQEEIEENLDQITEENNVENSTENGDLKVITDYVNANNYLFIIKNNRTELLGQIQNSWRYIENYITSEFKDELSSLIKTQPLAASDKTLILGFNTEEQIKEFKRMSLTKGMMAFIKEVVGKHMFILPVNSETWSQLLEISRTSDSLNNLVDIPLDIKDYSFEKTDIKEEKIASLFE